MTWLAFLVGVILGAFGACALAYVLEVRDTHRANVRTPIPPGVDGVKIGGRR